MLQFSLALLLFCFGLRACALRISSIEVPPAVANNSQVTLVCRYELEGAQLYSVKWYKNFVEFYRFLPAAAANGDGNAATVAVPASATSSSSASADSQQVRQEFEWEGINLDLSKSNATHVHLRQTSLASEATYKCEVSADEPSFATVALERHMKIYVLPRQKPAIADNNVASDNSAQVVSSQSQSSPSKLNTQRIYSVNDSINLTCTASASRPPAKVSWLINSQPLAESSKWLSRQQQHTFTNGLTETKQMLAFRLQPSHLLRNTTQRSLDALNITCLARLSVEFSSATTIHVPGGKSSTSQRRRNQQPAPLPAPESLELGAGDSTLVTSASTSLPPFRWPRPPVDRMRASAAGRRTGAHDTWHTTTPEGAETSADIEWARRTGRRGAKVYSSNQHHDQADQIEWLLKLSRPNELEPPLVEARTRSDEPEDPMETGGSGSYSTEWPGSTDEFATESSATASDQSDEANQDYELNEQVEFSCSTRGLNLVNLPNLRYVRLKWLINDKEVTQNKVNAFDGSRFYYKEYRRSDVIRPTHLPAVLSHRLPPSKSEGESNQSNELSLLATPINNTTDEDTSQLMVEFSATLLSLKDLSLKCLTLVDQPLIELASDPLIVSAATTGKFVEVDPAQHRQRGIMARKHQNQPRNRHTHLRQPGSSSSSQPMPALLYLFPLQIYFMMLISSLVNLMHIVW